MKRDEKITLGLGAAGLVGLTIWALTRKPAPPQIWYICPYCGAKFPSQEELTEHIRTKHPTEPVAYVCPYCGAIFATRNELYQHMLLEHDVTDPDLWQRKFWESWSADWSNWDFIGDGEYEAASDKYVSPPTSLCMRGAAHRKWRRVAVFKPITNIEQGRLFDWINWNMADMVYRQAQVGLGFWLQNELGLYPIPQGYYLWFGSYGPKISLHTATKWKDIAPLSLNCGVNYWYKIRLTWWWVGPPELNYPLRVEATSWRDGEQYQVEHYDIYNPAFRESPIKKVGVFNRAECNYSVYQFDGYHDDTEIYAP